MRIIGDGGHARVVRTLCEWDAFGNWICAFGDNRARKDEVEKHPDYKWSIATYNRFLWKEGVEIGDGTVIMDGAIVQPGARIGKHVIINTGATVDHDCIIGDYAHIAPGAHLCGHVEVGEGALVGVGVGVAPMCKIPPWVLVKARKLEMEPLYAV